MAHRTPLAIRWTTAAPDRVLARLRTLGLERGEDGRIALPSATIEVVERLMGDDRLELPEPRSGAAVGARGSEALDLVAIGYATVDTERAAGDRGTAPERTVTRMARDPHLGASATRLGDDSPQLILVEPDTEGRLAATLARHGEGPVVLYLGAVPFAETVEHLRRGGGGATSAADGPFGPSVLLLGGPVWGPHLIVVAGAPSPPSRSDPVPSTP